MLKRTCDIYRVARQCGVVLRDSKDHSPTSIRPRNCYCKPTIRAIGQAHGEEHLAIVLRLIVETDGNNTELHAATIKAVSAVVDSGLVEVGSSLFDALDGISLANMRRWASAARGVGSASIADTMAAALLWELASPAKLGGVRKIAETGSNEVSGDRPHKILQTPETDFSPTLGKSDLKAAA